MVIDALNVSPPCQVISIFGICIWTTPLFLVFLLPLAYAFVSVFLSFAGVSRDLKRLEGAHRSPVYSSFGETLSGLDTIRAFGQARRFADTHLLRMVSPAPRHTCNVT
jgi:ATP-binding cassette subfamily C (CFTR/MRP) protein 1